MSALDPEHFIISGAFKESRQYPTLRFNVASVVFLSHCAPSKQRTHVSKLAATIASVR